MSSVWATLKFHRSLNVRNIGDKLKRIGHLLVTWSKKPAEDALDAHLTGWNCQRLEL